MIFLNIIFELIFLIIRIFNNIDAAFNEVKVWKDENGNGFIEDGEMLTMEQAGVAGINLNYTDNGTIDNNGNAHKQTGSFIKSDGTTSSINDVWFDANMADTVDKSDVVIPDAIKLLPEVAGFGNVHSLQTAMALDETGTLKTLVEQYVAETNIVTRKNLIKNIIFHWAGVQDIDPESRKPSYFYAKRRP